MSRAKQSLQQPRLRPHRWRRPRAKRTLTRKGTGAAGDASSLGAEPAAEVDDRFAVEEPGDDEGGFQNFEAVVEAKFEKHGAPPCEKASGLPAWLAGLPLADRLALSATAARHAAPKSAWTVRAGVHKLLRNAIPAAKVDGRRLKQPGTKSKHSKM